MGLSTVRLLRMKTTISAKIKKYFPIVQRLSVSKTDQAMT